LRQLDKGMIMNDSEWLVHIHARGQPKRGRRSCCCTDGILKCYDTNAWNDTVIVICTSSLDLTSPPLKATISCHDSTGLV
jgi:hypothetical protein